MQFKPVKVTLKTGGLRTEDEWKILGPEVRQNGRLVADLRQVTRIMPTTMANRHGGLSVRIKLERPDEGAMMITGDHHVLSSADDQHATDTFVHDLLVRYGHYSPEGTVAEGWPSTRAKTGLTIGLVFFTLACVLAYSAWASEITSDTYRTGVVIAAGGLGLAAATIAALVLRLRPIPAGEYAAKLMDKGRPTNRRLSPSGYTRLGYGIGFALIPVVIAVMYLMGTFG